MKLEGSLDAFSLPDIFQLLRFTKKSGGLHLHHATTRGCVYFSQGAITGAVFDDSRQALGRRLVGSSTVDDAALAAAVDRAVADGIGVGRALLEAGAVDADLLRSIAAEQAVDAVFDFLRWTDGDFSFSVDEEPPDDVGVSLSVEDVVADARGRIEQWERVCGIIPSPDTVLALPVVVDESPTVTRDEWALLALVDGRRTVAELVALAGRGDYAVVSQLAGLVQRGLLAPFTADSEQGALALARRHKILARLEAATSAPAPVGPIAQARHDGASRGPSDGAAEPSVPPPATLAAVPMVADTRPLTLVDRPAVAPPASLAANVNGGSFGSVATAAVSRQLADRADAPLPTELLRDPTRSPEASPSIERDPGVNKSLLLRLIVGVRGL